MHLNGKFTSEKELKKKLDYIYLNSLKGHSFYGIIEVAFNEVTIITAIHNIKANKGSQTAGIDQLKMDKYLQMDKDSLIKLIKNSVKIYRPKPVKRVYIEKANGKMRPLGIPTIFDRIIQECLRIVLEPMMEAKFYPNSYGFRPYRATKHAIKDIINLINCNKNNTPIYAIEGDIKAYFDTINHRLLLKKLWKMGIRDKRVLSIINEMLKVGYIDNELHNITKDGTAQGSTISPLLANCYLNSFDWTVGRMYQTPVQKCKCIRNDRKRLTAHGVNPKYLVRYADDWTILTTEEKEAKRILSYLRKYYRYRLKLELSEEKTLITNLTVKPMKFLGFIVKAAAPRGAPASNKAKLVGKAYPNMEKVKTQVQNINNEVRKLKNIMSDTLRILKIKKINSMIMGVAEY